MSTRRRGIRAGNVVQEHAESGIGSKCQKVEKMVFDFQ